MEKLTKLFEPGKIGKMELKNRLVLAPLGYGMQWATKPNGYLTERFLRFYEARAKGGVGFINLTVNSLGRPYAPNSGWSVGSLTIIDDERIPSARRFNEVIHAYGTKVSFQISHYHAPAWQQRAPGEYYEPVIAGSPSPIRDPITGTVARALTIEEIKGLIEAYGQAGRRGKAADFDAVRIQACHHLGLREFLSPRTNKRTDEYGGSVENRARLACDVIRRVRKEVGPDYPILIRINGSEFIDGGITLDEAVQQVKLFVKAGVDAVDVSSGPTGTWQWPTMYQPWAPLVHLAEAIKKATKVPVITVGKIDAIHGERVLREGSADFIQMGRALMADPELPNKAKEGRLEDITHCIYCGHCQGYRSPKTPDSTCTVNMALGKEWDYELKPAEHKKKVMVIGGGPGGMKAAATLAERGHQTSLYEKSDRLGGQWNILSAYRPEMDILVKDLSRGIEKTGVKVFLNQKVTPPMVEKLKPDAVVVAAGATPAELDVPGIDGKNIVQATDVLTGKVDVGQEVVVIGGRLTGLDAAIFLAEKGKNVSIVSRRQIARGINPQLKPSLTELLIKYRVRLYPNSIPDSITEKGVNVWWNSSGESPAKAKDWVFFFLKADTVVLAVGAQSQNQLAEELSSLMSEVYTIGDCVQVRDAYAAIHEGSEVGHKI